MRPSAIWCGRVWRRCAACVRPASSCPGFLLAPWPSLQPAGLDTDAPALAGGFTVRATPRTTSSWRIASRSSRRRRHGATVWSPHRSRAAGLVARHGRARPAGPARHGAGGSGDVGCRTWRHHTLSRIHASSWRIWAWCRPSTPVAARAARASITKAGNGAARRMLIEAAWSYRFPARISRDQLLRQEGLAKPIRETAWKAQARLCAGDIASLLVRGSQRTSSPPRSHASWPASSGLSANKVQPARA